MSTMEIGTRSACARTLLIGFCFRRAVEINEQQAQRQPEMIRRLSRHSTGAALDIGRMIRFRAVKTGVMVSRFNGHISCRGSRPNAWFGVLPSRIPTCQQVCTPCFSFTYFHAVFYDIADQAPPAGMARQTESAFGLHAALWCVEPLPSDASALAIDNLGIFKSCKRTT
jgi:hypothetical protein